MHGKEDRRLGEMEPRVVSGLAGVGGAGQALQEFYGPRESRARIRMIILTQNT